MSADAIIKGVLARVESGAAVLWCAHWRDRPEDARECRGLASHTAVGWRESEQMLAELTALIEMRGKLHHSLRTRPALIVWPDETVLSVDPAKWAEVVRRGPAVGITVVCTTPVVEG